MLRRVRAPAVLVLLAACVDVQPVEEPIDRQLTLLAPGAFSRGELALVVPWLPPVMPQVLLDDTLAMDSLRRGGDTLVVTLWDTTNFGRDVAAGPHMLTLRGQDWETDPATFDVYGLATFRQTAPLLAGATVAGGTRVWVGLDQGLGRVDLRWPSLLSVVDTTVSWNCLFQAGPSVVPRAVVVVVRDSTGGCGRLHARSYDHGMTEVDSGPPSAGVDLAAHLGPGRWLLHTRDSILVRFRAANGTWSGPAYPTPHSGSDRNPVLAAGTERAVVWGNGSTRDTAYLLDTRSGALVAALATDGAAAAFLGGGDTLMLVGADSVLLLDAVTGRLLRALPGPPHRYPEAIVEDPGRPWIYFASVYEGLLVSVLDRRDWRWVGVASGRCVCLFQGAVTVSPGDRQLIAIETTFGTHTSTQPWTWPAWAVAITLSP